MRRRQALALITGGFSVVAGCSSNSESNSGAQTRELSTTSPADPIDCDANPYPVTRADDNSYPEQINGFELTASKDTVSIGEAITFTLTNVGDERRGIGQKYKYNILRRDTEWKPIFYTQDQPVWTDLGINVRPGGEFRWPFTVDRKGLERQNGGNPSYHICFPLQPGEYRFAFFGVAGRTVATTFTVENS